MEPEVNGLIKNRDFACACGKKYFSYAALFTHIKQKHDGKAPGPIVRPRSERKRGRPRKTPLPGSQNKNSDSEFGNNSNGYSGANEGNYSAQESQKKTKKDAEMLLGSGSFQAFQAYRGDIYLNDESKKVSMKNGSCQSEGTKRKDIKAMKKEMNGCGKQIGNGYISNQQAVNSQLEHFLQSHNTSLTQILSHISVRVDQQLLQNSIEEKCPFLKVKPQLSSQTIIGSINNYLRFISNIIQKQQYLFITLNFCFFLQFLGKNKNYGPLVTQLHRDEAISFANQYVCSIKKSDFEKIQGLLNLQIINPSINSQSNYSLSDFITDSLILYSYWIKLADEPKQEQNNQKKSKSNDEKKPIKNKEDTKYGVSTQAERELSQLMKIEKHRHGQPRIIKTIEDILAVNNIDSQEYSIESQEDGEQEVCGDMEIGECKPKSVV